MRCTCLIHFLHFSHLIPFDQSDFIKFQSNLLAEAVEWRLFTFHFNACSFEIMSLISRNRLCNTINKPKRTDNDQDAQVPSIETEGKHYIYVQVADVVKCGKNPFHSPYRTAYKMCIWFLFWFGYSYCITCTLHTDHLHVYSLYLSLSFIACNSALVCSFCSESTGI